MKNFTKYILQRLLGYHRYLVVFAKYKIRTLKKDRKEKDFFAFISAIQNEGIILDVGANIGIMTYHLSKQFSNRKILAIEPMPNNIAVLEEVISTYDLNNVALIKTAVGEDKSMIKMVLPLNGKVKMQGLAHVVHDSINEWNEGDQFEIPCDRLDNIVGQERVAAIKMDIENFEFFALKGGEEMLKRDKPIVYLELWENENRDKCFELLRKLTYFPFVMVDGKLIPFDPAIHKKQNFIFQVSA